MSYIFASIKWMLTFVSLLLVACFVVSVVACSSQQKKPAKTVSETIPLTMANVRGHEEMYKQGWFVVSSSEKALRYANEHGAKSAWRAINRARLDIASRTEGLGPQIKSDVVSGVGVGKNVFVQGTRTTQNIMGNTEKAVEYEKKMAGKFSRDAYSRFVRGYLTLGERTSDDLNALRSVPGNYFENLESDFKNINRLSKNTREKLTPEINASWSQAFERGKEEFIGEYQKSGSAGNSIAGLGTMIKGYWKAFYYGVVSPGADNLKYVGARSGVEIGNAIALPTSALLVISGRTVQSLGMSVWYTTSAGYKLVSPTIEGGLLTGMSLLSTAAVPITALGGTSVGMINQVAVTAAAPVAASTTSIVKTGLDTAKYGAFVVYDIASATTRVSIEELSTGVVLGYNGLTALPTQAILGVTSGVFFLAWDGPRLVIAYASGEIKSGDDKLDIGALPVGSVVDLNKLRLENNVEIKIISDDAETINHVLNKAPEDMKQEN